MTGLPFLSKPILVGGLVGICLGAAAPIAVWLETEGLRASLRQTIVATNDPDKIAAFEAWLQTDRTVSAIILGLTFLIAAVAPVGLAWLSHRHRMMRKAVD